MLEKLDVTEDPIYETSVTEVVTMIKHPETAGERKNNLL
jgi:hypothetical protein